MRAAGLMLLTAALVGCSDNREQDMAACKAQGMAAQVKNEPMHSRYCMTGKGYVFREDEFCSSSYGYGVVTWACFDKRPWGFTSK